ncbi:MAG TPA: HAD family phosphatase [Kiritimatiellia bacterium]|nr:HAD family phosphatase [Kiritimatiellia bacterium]
MKTWGVIFDWDGVLVDSSRLHERSWEVLALEEGRELPEGHFRRGFGMKNEVIIPEVLGWAREKEEVSRLAIRKEAIYRSLVLTEGLDFLPGVKVFLERLREAGVGCAIGSSTERKNLACVLDGNGGWEWFAEVVSGDLVERGKPHPDIFLLAAKRLGVERAVVFEDAMVGIEAARRAGMPVVAVAGTHRAEELVHADRVVGRLDECTVEDVGRLVG